MKTYTGTRAHDGCCVTVREDRRQHSLKRGSLARA
jgi:hypothetical protein